MQKNYQNELNLAVNLGRKSLSQGQVASYIPQLAYANPSSLGACITLPTGEQFCSGDTETRFTFQSISKVLTLVLALQTSGYEYVFKKVGMEPSGDPFNSIIKLESSTAVPHNPFINAGAIVVASCINSSNPIDDLLVLTRKFTMDDTVEIDDEVYQSEKVAGLRNRSLAYFMASEGILEGNVEQQLDKYFKACSMLTTAKGLSNMGMILANNGTNPLTGEVIAEEWQIQIVRTFMMTCGLYDQSGEFAIKAGIPSKSGVGGGILSACQNGIGIGVYGPALGTKGNSIGGVCLLEYLSKSLNLHSFSQKN